MVRDTATNDWGNVRDSVASGYISHAANTVRMLGSFMDGTNQFVSVNGVDGTSAAQTVTALNSSILRIMLGFTGIGVSGDIFEIVLLKQNPTTLQRQKIEGYLSWKWTDSGSFLPTGHRYKNFPPP